MAAEDDTILRFPLATRLFHWWHAVPFLLLLITGLLLYVPAAKAVHVGGFRLVALLHVGIGIAFIASPLPLYFGLRDKQALRHDLMSALRPESTDLAWITYTVATLAGIRRPAPLVGKFNAGQKLNSLFSIVITAGLMATGAVLAINYFARGTLPVPLVEAVFPWHTRLMIVALPVTAGHVYLALLHPSTRHSIHSMLSGRISRRWAERHHHRWVAEIDTSTLSRG